MTLLDLRNLVLYWLDDLQAGYFTATQVNRWLNNAAREVQKLLLNSGENWYRVCKETTTVSNQAEYALPEDFLKVNRLEIVKEPHTTQETRYPLLKISENQLDQFPFGPGFPSSYYMSKNRIILLPSPDQAYTVRMAYSYRITDMSLDSDVPDVPEEYREFIAVLAAIDGMLKDDRDPTALYKKKEDYLDLLKKDSDQRNIDSSKTVHVTDEADFGRFF